MIIAEKLSYEYPGKDLYDQVSFTIEDGQHCAFIGSSGSGKSTLVDMIMDPDKYMYDGKLEVDIDSKVGYISQFSQIDRDSELTVFDYIAEPFLVLQKQIEDICKEMETAEELEDLLEQYQEAFDGFTAIDGDNYESNINSKLNVADLGHTKSLKVTAISGGEFKLVQVIKEMLLRPDLLVMDEPDVFLDFENLNSLKNLINTHKGTLLIITHNRYLLDHCFNKILHLEDCTLREFDGQYIEYNFDLLQYKIEQMELAVADDLEIARLELMIDKLRIQSTMIDSAARGRSLNSRKKIHERLVNRRVIAPFVHIKQPAIKLETDQVVEDALALKVENYHAAYDEVLMEDVHFAIGSQDKVALIGPNGTGKTTLFRDLMKGEHPAIHFEEGITPAYLSQVQGEILNEDNTVLNEFMDLGFETYTEAKAYLAEYNFVDDGVDQVIGTLSGGEKNILQLAKIGLGKANLLLLDEPSSHLDIYAQIALEEAINAYTGAILMISHDYYTIINTMDYVLLIDDKQIRRVSMRKFRKTIYKHHFDRDYLALEKQKKAVEMDIAVKLQEKDFETAKKLSEELEELIAKIK